MVQVSCLIIFLWKRLLWCVLPPSSKMHFQIPPNIYLYFSSWLTLTASNFWARCGTRGCLDSDESLSYLKLSSSSSSEPAFPSWQSFISLGPSLALQAWFESHSSNSSVTAPLTCFSWVSFPHTTSFRCVGQWRWSSLDMLEAGISFYDKSMCR